MDKYDIAGVKIFEYTKIIGLDKITFGRNIIIDYFVLLYATAPMKIGNYVHVASLYSGMATCCGLSMLHMVLLQFADMTSSV